jgi:ribonuclease HI
VEQLCIFNTPDKPAVRWKLYIDGASRANPGHAGAGIVIFKDDIVVQKIGYYLGIKTNNQAEYMGLLLGVLLVKKAMQPKDHLAIFSDSELMVRQLQGVYRVKNIELQKCFSLAKHLLEGVSCRVQHVLRAQNAHADEMANKGVDTRHAVPEEFLLLLKDHHIFL